MADPAIELGEMKYIGVCSCQRKALINGEWKVVCGGKLYEITPMKINGIVFPVGATVQRWCRSKHFKMEGAKDNWNLM